MSTSAPLTAQRATDLVMANRVIRAPYYRADHDEGVRFADLDRGLQWGADAIPTLLGLFRVERNPRDDRPGGWIGFARATGEAGRCGWTSTGSLKPTRWIRS